MSPTTRKQSKSNKKKEALDAEKYANRALRKSRKALLLDVSQGMLEACEKNGNRLPYGHLENLLKQLVKTEPWITRNILNKAFMMHRRQALNEKSTTKDQSGTATTSVLVTEQFPKQSHLIAPPVT